MKWVLIVLAAVVGLVILVAAIGSFLPRNHVASSSLTLHQPPDSVWRVIRNLGGVPQWFAEIKTSERLPDAGGVERWQQTVSSNFVMPLEVAESQPPSRLVTRIASPPDAAFGGRWIYEIAPADGGSRITITEDGWVANPIFRVMTYAFFGVHGTLDKYLRALGKKFGEEVDPVHVR